MLKTINTHKTGFIVVLPPPLPEQHCWSFNQEWLYLLVLGDRALKSRENKGWKSSWQSFVPEWEPSWGLNTQRRRRGRAVDVRVVSGPESDRSGMWKACWGYSRSQMEEGKKKEKKSTRSCLILNEMRISLITMRIKISLVRRYLGNRANITK